MDTHPTLSDGRYVVKRCIGRGGMAAVFLVYDNTFEVDRAIKVLNPSWVVRPTSQQRFRTEAQAMARLNHPNIVRVYDHGMEGMTSYIVMDYLPHGSLQTYLDAHGPLDRERALCMTLDLADALAHAHEAGVIHRDIKPDNALLSSRGGLLTDFGLARVADLSDGSTKTRAVMGTPSFMSPEQRLSAKSSNHLTDIYALTATLFTILTRKDPVDLYDITEQDGLLAGLDNAVADVIRKGCAANQEDRFQSAEALAEALEAIRERPGTERVRLDHLPMAATDTADIPGLRKLWATYTQPSQDDSGQESDFESGASDHTFDFAGISDEAEEDGTSATVNPTNVRPRRKTIWVLSVIAAMMVACAMWSIQFFVSSPPEPFSVKAENATSVGYAVAKARQHLLSGQPTRAAALLKELHESHPDEPALVTLHGMAAFSRGADASAETDLKRAAGLSEARENVVARMLSYGTAPPNAQEKEGWETVREPTEMPEIDLLYLALSWHNTDDTTLAREISALRKKHPTHAVFAVLDARRQRQAAKNLEARRKVIDTLGASIADFPQSSELLQMRGQLLYLDGQYEAAAEVMGAAARLDSGDARAHQVLGAIAALKGDRDGQNTQLMLAIGDAVPRDQQAHFLQQYGLLLAGVGQLHEANKIWVFAQSERTAEEGPARDHADEVAILDATLGVHAETPQWSATLTRQKDQLLIGAEKTATQALETELLYLEGVAAQRSGDVGTANAALQKLTERAEREGVTARLKRNLLALEIAVSAAPHDDATLARVSAQFDVETTPCIAQWAQARVAAAYAATGRTEQLAALKTLSEALQSGACMASPSAHVPRRAEVHLLLAEAAMSQGETLIAQEAIRRFKALWADPDPDLPFTARIVAVSKSAGRPPP